eukprot:3756909-Pleurochrysis_carterae.AAC.1
MCNASLVPAAVRAGTASQREQMDAVRSVASELLSPLGLRLLQSIVTAHALSARVEMWRQLARKEAEEHSVRTSARAWVRACGRAFEIPADDEGAARAMEQVREAVLDANCVPAGTSEIKVFSDEVRRNSKHALSCDPPRAIPCRMCCFDSSLFLLLWWGV